MAAGVAAATAVQRPSLDALVPRLVRHDQQAAANALTSLNHDAEAVIAPALGGALAAASLPWAYGVDVATFVVSCALLSRARSVPRQGAPTGVTIAAIAAGVRYATARRDLLGTYVVDIVAMAFAMPQALFPFLADRLHHPQALGVLYSAGAVGGVFATVTSGWTGRIHRAGIELLSYSSGPTLGNARAGLMARIGGVRFSIGAGGALCIGGVLLTAALLPSFLRYDNRTDPHAIAERARRAAATMGKP